MKIFEIFRVAVLSLLAHKTRALLTMLGIIIGVGAVIAMVAVGQGAQSAVEAQISSLGTNVLIIFPGHTSQGGVRGSAGTDVTLTQDDVDAIRAQCPTVAYVTPTVRTFRQVIAGNLNWNTAIYGGNTEYFLIRDWRIRTGDFFTEADVKGGTKVCLIGRTVQLALFPDSDPLGQTIRIGSLPFKVIGTLEPKGQNTMGMDQDDIIIAPFTTVQRKVLRQDHVGSILLSAIRQDRILAAQQEVTELIRIRHRLSDWQDDDFTVRTQTDIASAATATTDIMTTLLGSIASVSLLVGGIGIMNIMLVSVTERTREIGVRMSIGARRSDILGQFLMEAVTLSILGGLIGVAVGLIASNLISELAGWVILISSDSVILAFVFAILVGVFFGFYPAQKASRLNPIEALRYE